MWLNVYVTFKHYVTMSFCHLHIVCKLCVVICTLCANCVCHLHIVCKLCVSFLSMSVFVSVIFVMSICCIALACHFIMSNVIWSLSCYGQLGVGCFHDRVKTGLVLWSLRNMCPGSVQLCECVCVCVFLFVCIPLCVFLPVSLLDSMFVCACFIMCRSSTLSASAAVGERQ